MILNEDYDIEPIQSADALDVHQLMILNSERFKDYFPKTLQQNSTVESSKEFAIKKEKEYKLKEEFLFTIKEKSTKKVAGLVYIKELDWNGKKGEFAYCVGKKFGGKGLISKSIEVLSVYAFTELGLEELEIIVHETNIPSVKVAEKNGFIWKETLLNKFRPKDRPAIDMELYILRK
ncbi:MAG: GNAT family N-acetyltransferase [Flavobacteriaceae bacterium]|nr:GNAT family N-acetyltransferase [Flavobacteriaceae bacterium]